MSIAQAPVVSSDVATIATERESSRSGAGLSRTGRDDLAGRSAPLFPRISHFYAETIQTRAKRAPRSGPLLPRNSHPACGDGRSPMCIPGTATPDRPAHPLTFAAIFTESNESNTFHHL
ncbi:hypothetical protein Acsp03_45560 [Actinomadura sp. NBRC 104412]|nr:hypothetical protein Acsp03_45560 [Actinomadura sp. NBRC 104412]